MHAARTIKTDSLFDEITIAISLQKSYLFRKIIPRLKKMYMYIHVYIFDLLPPDTYTTSWSI